MTTLAQQGWWHPLMPSRLVRAAVNGQRGASARLARACRAIAAVRRAAADPCAASALDDVADRLARLDESMIASGRPL